MKHSIREWNVFYRDAFSGLKTIFSNEISASNDPIKYSDNNNQYHKENGPAVIYSNGDNHWYKHGLLHREDGPAIDDEKVKAWYFDGERHRLDGPAYLEYRDGHLIISEWWYRGKWIDVDSQEEFERLIKLELFW